MPYRNSPRRPSVMRHQFSQVPSANIPRSSFDRSHGYKTTFDAGWLVPVFVDEALPGDTFACRMTAFARLATPIVPIMDNLMMSSFFFAVPIRLIWDNWQRFNGEQDNPEDSTDFVIPQMSPPAGGYENGSLDDYFGLPTQVDGFSHSSLWHRAYNLIFNEWFRDENLRSSRNVPKGDGPDDPVNFTLQRRGKRHDYFTSALPWPQKGDSVELPLGTTAPVISDGNDLRFNTAADPTSRSFSIRAEPGNPIQYTGTQIAASGPALYADQGLITDLSTATAATINQLRQAFQVQKLFERDARGGTRYTEIIRSHFGVVSPDARLQRPEYLGGGMSPVNVSPVAQTSSTDATTPQGNLSAFGTATLDGHGFTKSFTEHCVLIGLINVRADLTYQQGLNRMFSRSTRFDFYWPALSHIGEQAILNKEIFTQGTAADEDVFGFQERYAEYRYKPSQITGKFRSNDAQSLDVWHLSQDFGTLPTLSASFINDEPPVERVIAVPSEPQFLFDSFFSLRCARPMPLYGVPGLIDHF